MMKFARSENLFIMLAPVPQICFYIYNLPMYAHIQVTSNLILVKCMRAPQICARNSNFWMVAYRAGFFTRKTSGRAPTFILYLVRTKNVCTERDLGNGSCDFLEPILF